MLDFWLVLYSPKLVSILYCEIFDLEIILHIIDFWKMYYWPYNADKIKWLVKDGKNVKSLYVYKKTHNS